MWCVHLQAAVYEHSGQHLEIELFDEDPDKDDFLGRYCDLTRGFEQFDICTLQQLGPKYITLFTLSTNGTMY